MKHLPFPWLCGECGHTEVRPVVIDYKTEINHLGRLHKVCLKNIEVPTCGNCGEQWMDITTDEKIQEAFNEKLNSINYQVVWDGSDTRMHESNEKLDGQNVFIDEYEAKERIIDYFAEKIDDYQQALQLLQNSQ